MRMRAISSLLQVFTKLQSTPNTKVTSNTSRVFHNTLIQKYTDSMRMQLLLRIRTLPTLHLQASWSPKQPQVEVVVEMMMTSSTSSQTPSWMICQINLMWKPLKRNILSHMSRAWTLYWHRNWLDSTTLLRSSRIPWKTWRRPSKVSCCFQLILKALLIVLRMVQFQRCGSLRVIHHSRSLEDTLLINKKDSNGSKTGLKKAFLQSFGLPDSSSLKASWQAKSRTSQESTTLLLTYLTTISKL